MRSILVSTSMRKELAAPHTFFCCWDASQTQRADQHAMKEVLCSCSQYFNSDSLRIPQAETSCRKAEVQRTVSRTAHVIAGTLVQLSQSRFPVFVLVLYHHPHNRRARSTGLDGGGSHTLYDVVHRVRNIVARVGDRCLYGLYGRRRLSSRSGCFNRLLVLRHVIEIAIGDRRRSNLVGCIAKPSVDKFLNNKLGLPEPTLKEHLFLPRRW